MFRSLHKIGAEGGLLACSLVSRTPPMDLEFDAAAKRFSTEHKNRKSAAVARAEQKARRLPPPPPSAPPPLPPPPHAPAAAATGTTATPLSHNARHQSALTPPPRPPPLHKICPICCCRRLALPCLLVGAILPMRARALLTRAPSRRATVVARAPQAKEREALRAKQAKWERDAVERREAEAARLAEVEAKRDQDLERNRGVAYIATLRPELSTAAEAKGIVRRADKITLPRSASTELEMQNATRHGQLFFELSTAAGRVTHASILDFSATEGTVGAPAEVLRLLGLDDIAEGRAPELRPQLSVRYRALKRATFARVQPVASSFAAEIDDVKGVLERELLLRTTLSAGDELRVREGGADYALRIVSLDPEGAASIIDTDLEVDVLPSVEAETAAAAEAAAAAARQAALDAAIEARRTAEAEATAAAADAERAAAAAAEEAAAARAARRDAAATALAGVPDVAAGGGASVGVAIRLPDGTRCTRRFAPEAPLASLFALVEASAWAECPAHFALAASYPRRVFSRDDAAAGRTLADAGLVSAQEALFVEMLQE